MRTILLIGAGGGMGRACAALFLKNGDTVIGLDRPGAQMPEGAVPLYADVTDPDAVSAASASVKEQIRSIDAIVYAAGIYDADSLVEID